MLDLLAGVRRLHPALAPYADRLLIIADNRVQASHQPARAAPRARAPFALTAGERRVLALMALGLPDDEISRRLKISLNTVRSHNKNIFRKLDVRSRTQAVVRARTLGLAE